ncbi:MAG: HAMP domain-containing histidine kinase [Candidatus Eremiobacteraeota bacterium]|nr:HAMP domain-containing histidine kinase [Candidatus Eremiobacteraeota bacterium]
MNLRARLTLTYIAVLVVGLLVFATIAVAAIDRALHSSLDARLQSAAHAMIALTDVRSGRIHLDPDDRAQFRAILGVQLNGTVFQRDGSTAASSVADQPDNITELIRSRPPQERIATLGSRDFAIRALVLPIERSGSIFGYVVTWRPSDWIDEFDRTEVLSLAVAALVIIALAALAGDLVTRRALQDAFARQRRFTADASHELRAPLSVIRAEADLALRRDRAEGEYRSALAAIASEADLIETLIEDLLSAARAEDGTLARDETDICELCAQAVARVAASARAKNVDLQLDAPTQALVLADERALSRAVLALLHNALKFTPANGRADVIVRQTGPTIELLVRDSGPGFSSEALEHALERFWREDSAQDSGGSGLGLAIARSIVEASGATISLSNTAGGAEVKCTFRAATRAKGP